MIRCWCVLSFTNRHVFWFATLVNWWLRIFFYLKKISDKLWLNSSKGKIAWFLDAMYCWIIFSAFSKENKTSLSGNIDQVKKNSKVFHHRTHFLNRLWLKRIWSGLPTPFIKELFVYIDNFGLLDIKRFPFFTTLFFMLYNNAAIYIINSREHFNNFVALLLQSSMRLMSFSPHLTSLFFSCQSFPILYTSEEPLTLFRAAVSTLLQNVQKSVTNV